MSANDFLESTKDLLDLNGIDEYDSKLLLLIGAVISKLDKEGVNKPSNENVQHFNQYQTAIYYGVKLAFDEDVNTSLFQMLYVDTVENMRMSLIEL